MKTVEQVTKERDMCRGILVQVFAGKNGVLMQEYVSELLGVNDSLVDPNTHLTYYNLGKREAFNLLIDEAKRHAR